MVAAVSGTLLFISQATEYAGKTVFQVELIILLSAGNNMLMFELITARSAPQWDMKAVPPPAVRLAGAISLGCWVLIILSGPLDRLRHAAGVIRGNAMLRTGFARCGEGSSGRLAIPGGDWKRERLPPYYSYIESGALRETRAAPFADGGNMSKRPLLTLLAAFAVCAALPGYGQVVRPDPTQPGGFPLKPGSAKALIQEKCVVCHDLKRVVNSNKDAEEWRETVFMMKAAGALIDDAQAKEISDYFIANYLGLERPKPVIIAGPANVRFKVWDTPTPGSRPHDPLATPDGMIWWSGQFANRLGRLNPATGEMKEFPIPVLGGPHGLINDKDGNIWYAGNWGGHIGKLDPKTGEWKQYYMPDPNVKDPHTPLFDKDGILWFSAQNAGVMGRLDPKTGDIKLFRPVGGPGQQPYALRFLSDRRQPWFSYFGSNKIATINPDTFELKEYVLPNSKTRVRRMDVTSDDMIWFGDWSNGKLVRFDPKTGATKEYDGPGGQLAQPYGIVVIDDIIWYCESNLRPNTLVRFDPKTEKFQTWEMPFGGGIVRHMVKTPDGNIAMALSGVSKIALVEILPSNSN